MTALYHGGFPDLHEGDMILPPSESGADTTASYGNFQCRTDRVYLTTDIQAACLYASMHPSDRGWVYLVTPVGELEPDPDCDMPGLSYSCEQAVVRKRVKIDRQFMRLARKAMLKPDKCASAGQAMERTKLAQSLKQWRESL